jgi:hypothetical protein
MPHRRIIISRFVICPYRSSVSEIIKSFSSRRRLAHLYDIASYLQDQNVEVGSRDREVSLSPETNAVFVAVGGRRYLHDFCDGYHSASRGQSGFRTTRMGLKNPDQVALMVDEFGIIDVAFEENNGQLQWILGTKPSARNIFVERAPTGKLSSIKVTCDVSSICLVGNGNLLTNVVRKMPIYKTPPMLWRPTPTTFLHNSGRWIPWSFHLGTQFTFPHDDYFVPTVTDITTPDIVYVSYRRDGAISGIHDQPEGNCTQVLLSPPAGTRSLKFLVLCHSLTLSQIPCIQVRRKRFTSH